MFHNSLAIYLIFLNFVIYCFATLAQLVEQLICNQPVGGSSPSGGSNPPTIQLPFNIF